MSTRPCHYCQLFCLCNVHLVQSQQEATWPLTLGAQEAHFPPIQWQQEDKITTLLYSQANATTQHLWRSHVPCTCQSHSHGLGTCPEQSPGFQHTLVHGLGLCYNSQANTNWFGKYKPLSHCPARCAAMCTFGRNLKTTCSLYVLGQLYKLLQKSCVHPLWWFATT